MKQTAGLPENNRARGESNSVTKRRMLPEELRRYSSGFVGERLSLLLFNLVDYFL